MQLTSSPQSIPGSCFVCGASDREWFVDFENITIEFHGAFYICNLCLAEMASLAGYATPETLEAFKLSNEELTQENATLKMKVNGLETAVAGLTTAKRYSNTIADPQSHPQLFDVADVLNEGEGESGAVESGENNSTEQTPESQLAGVRSDGDNTDDVEFSFQF